MPEDENAVAVETTAEFTIHKIYVKDLSFENPNAPLTFNQQWNPQLEINVENTARAVGESVYEVVLTTTVTAKLEETTAFLVEVQLAGLFQCEGSNEEELRPILGGACPNVLFPYAREAISDVVARGGFPQLLLSPVDFVAMYAAQQGAASVAAT